MDVCIRLLCFSVHSIYSSPGLRQVVAYQSKESAPEVQTDGGIGRTLRGSHLKTCHKRPTEGGTRPASPTRNEWPFTVGFISYLARGSDQQFPPGHARIPPVEPLQAILQRVGVHHVDGVALAASKQRGVPTGYCHLPHDTRPHSSPSRCRSSSRPYNWDPPRLREMTETATVREVLSADAYRR